MSKTTLLKPDENFDGLPPWMVAMRKMVTECVSEADVREIVQSQVKRAKEGDQAAIKFVFGQLLGGESFKGATFVQNNNYAGNGVAAPVKSKPGSPQRIEELRRRVSAHAPLHTNGDAGFEEEEHLRD